MAILYADRITGSMRRMMEETERRRQLQEEYNREHGIIPRTIIKSVAEIERSTRVADARVSKHETDVKQTRKVAEARATYAANTGRDPVELQRELEAEMRDAAAQLDFERAALLRDQLLELRSQTEVTKAGGARRVASFR